MAQASAWVTARSPATHPVSVFNRSKSSIRSRPGVIYTRAGLDPTLSPEPRDQQCGYHSSEQIHKV